MLMFTVHGCWTNILYLIYHSYIVNNASSVRCDLAKIVYSFPRKFSVNVQVARYCFEEMKSEPHQTL